VVNVEASNIIKREVYVTNKELPLVDKNCKQVKGRIKTLEKGTVVTIDPNDTITCNNSSNNSTTFVRSNVSTVNRYYIEYNGLTRRTPEMVFNTQNQARVIGRADILTEDCGDVITRAGTKLLFIKKGDIVTKAEPFEIKYCTIKGLFNQQFEMFKINYEYSDLTRDFSLIQNDGKPEKLTVYIAQEYLLKAPETQSDSKRNRQNSRQSKSNNQRKIFKTQRNNTQQPPII
jgi:hypothetical protein